MRATIFGDHARRLLAGFAAAGLAVAASGLAAGNAAAATALNVSCAAGAPGVTAAIVQADQNPAGAPYTITLAAGCTYTFTSAYLGNATVTGPNGEGTVGLEDWYGPSALPAIATTITIAGSGATLAATQPAKPDALSGASFDPDFRFFYVGADPASASTKGYTTPGAGNLTLEDLTLSGGEARGGSGQMTGGGAGMGGAIFNQGTLTLDAVTATANTAQGGDSAAGGANSTAFGAGGMGSDGDPKTGNGGGFGPGTFGGAAGGSVSAGTDGGGGGGGFGQTETGAASTDLNGAAGGGPATGLGASAPTFQVGFAAGGRGGDGSGGGAADLGGGGATGGAFGAGGSDNSLSAGGGGGVGGGAGAADAAGGFGGGGGLQGSGGFGGGAGAGFGTTISTGFGGGDGDPNGQSGGGGAGMGGAIFNMQGSITIESSTLEGNTAAGGSAAATTAQPGQGLGGAIFNLNGSVALTDATIDANTAAQGGGGVFDLGYDSATRRAATVTLIDSILYGNGASGDLVTQAPLTTSAGVNASSATATSSAQNIVGSSAGVITGAWSASDPRLGSLQNNGGPGMLTQLPGAGSPAIDAGTCPLPVDELGSPRPDVPGTGCDLGAVETVSAPVCSAVNASTLIDTPVKLQLACGGEKLAYQNPGAPAHGSLSGFDSATGAVTYTPAAGFSGTDSFMFTASNGVGLSNSATATVTVIGSPAVAITSPSDGSSYVQGQAVNAAYTCAEAAGGPGLKAGSAGCGAPVAAGSPIDTTTTGKHSFTVTATSTDGLSATDTVSYTVIAATTTVTTTAPVTTTPAVTVTTTSTTPINTSKTAAHRCPAITGAISGRALGPIRLGMTRSQEERLYRRSSNHGNPTEAFICLTPTGIRVGFASGYLLLSLPASQRTHLRNRVVWASTSAPSYAIDTIRTGATLAALRRQLRNGNRFHIGLNFWYLARFGQATAIFKLRHGRVQELGIADRALTRTRAQQHRFITSFHG